MHGHGQHQPPAFALYRVSNRISCCGYEETSVFKTRRAKVGPTHIMDALALVCA
jgi:hypothetical protein